MKGLKFLISCAAVSALALMCSTASLADEYTATATYSDGNVTISNISDYKALVGSGDLTLLILNSDVANITEETKSAIVQIDQAQTFSTVPVGDLADGTYYVRIGGAEAGANNPNGFISTTFTVGSSTPTPSYTLGDVDGVTGVSINDATTVTKHVAGTVTLTGNELLAADVDGVKGVSINDATTITKYVAGTVTEFTPAP